MSRVTVTIEADGISEDELAERVEHWLTIGWEDAADFSMNLHFHHPDTAHNRSAVTGEFVSAEVAAEEPETTIHEAGSE